MTKAGAETSSAAQLHGILRFAVGTAAAFVISEAMGWYPSFLAPLLAGTLLANVPTALPPRAGVALILVQAGAAYAAFALTSLVHQTPIVEFGVVGLVIFICFALIARGASLLPLLLILIAFSAVPVVTMVIPQQAGALSLAFTRSMVIAVAVVWIVHVAWPETAPVPPPAAKRAFASPLAAAAAGTAIVLPLMLLYLMYGITDALPLLITTVVVVVNFDPQRGALQAAAMIIGNFIGGIVAFFAFGLLQIAPSLATLCLIAFLLGSGFASRIERGGPGGIVALITFNQAMVLFSLALVPGGADNGLWLTRLVQFSAACTFAVGMLTLIFSPHSARYRLAE